MAKNRVLALALLCPIASHATDRDCEGLDWQEGDVARTATIASSDARTYFLSDAPATEGCPSADAKCRRKSYLVPGDDVVVWFDEDGYACASFVGAKGRVTSGYLPVAVLAIDDAPKLVPQSEWVGTWERDEGEVRISAEGTDRIAVEGDATWGAGDPDRIERGAVHMGTIERTVVPLAPGVLRFATGDEPDDPEDEYRCRVALQRAGDWLLVDDNFQCGGMNVSFDGIYTRTPE